MTLKTELGRYRSKLISFTFAIVWISGCGGGNRPSNDTISGDSPEFTGEPEPVQDSPGGFPFHGTQTLDDYDGFLDATYLGVTALTIQPLAKKRIFNGRHPRRHASALTVFNRACGSRKRALLNCC